MPPYTIIVHLAYLTQCLGPYLSCAYDAPPVEGLILQITQYLALNYLDTLFAAIYLQRLLLALQQIPTQLWHCTKHLVFLASLRMADKFVNDGAYARSHLFNIVVGTFNLLPAHLHRCELTLLMAMRWDLKVSMDQLRALDACFRIIPKPRIQVCQPPQAGLQPPKLRREDAKLTEEQYSNLII